MFTAQKWKLAGPMGVTQGGMDRGRTQCIWVRLRKPKLIIGDREICLTLTLKGGIFLMLHDKNIIFLLT